MIVKSLLSILCSMLWFSKQQTIHNQKQASVVTLYYYYYYYYSRNQFLLCYILRYFNNQNLNINWRSLSTQKHAHLVSLQINIYHTLLGLLQSIESTKHSLIQHKNIPYHSNSMKINRAYGDFCSVGKLSFLSNLFTSFLGQLKIISVL